MWATWEKNDHWGKYMTIARYSFTHLYGEFNILCLYGNVIRLICLLQKIHLHKTHSDIYWKCPYSFVFFLSDVCNICQLGIEFSYKYIICFGTKYTIILWHENASTVIQMSLKRITNCSYVHHQASINKLGDLSLLTLVLKHFLIKVGSVESGAFTMAVVNSIDGFFFAKIRYCTEIIPLKIEV